MTFIPEKIRELSKVLQSRIVLSSTAVSEMKIIPCEYKKSNTPPSDSADWKDYRGEELIAPKDSHWWIKFSVDVPHAADKRAYRLYVETGIHSWDATNPQCTLFLDGNDTAVQAFDTNHTFAPITEGHHDVVIYLYNGMNGTSNFRISFTVKEIDTDTEGLWYDMTVPFEAMKCLPKDSIEYSQILNYLDRATLLLDLRHNGTKEYFDSVAEARRFLKEEFYEKVCGKGNGGTVALVGHTHIDVAWLWTLAQTKEKAQRSFSTAINLMDQYPDYIFMSSQPQLYQYVKENDPKLYEKIKARIKEGRWEAEGAMWLEADTNIISGESLVRQILLGKRFMREEFGKENIVLWLPDVFGYSASLPQILKKSGVDNFFTAKLYWSETDKPVNDNFIWKGIDGSDVFVMLSPCYVNNTNPNIVYRRWRDHKNKNYSDKHILETGFGDGGGGTTPAMLENYERLKYGLPGFPKVTMEAGADIVKDVKAQFLKNAEELRFTPEWKGELYLEMHRGTYTSIAKNKRNNRRSELLYQALESVSVADKVFNKNSVYPYEFIDESWHNILKLQFHDIIPGSSIKEVYDDSDVEYAQLLGDGKRLFDEKLGSIASGIKTDGGYLVYNASPFDVSGAVIETESGKTVTDDVIPAHGWRVVKPSAGKGSVKADKSSLENDLVRVCFNDKYHIVSVYDKVNGREVIESGKEANVLEIYEDYPRDYDAWEITEYHKQKKWIASDVASVEVINEGCCAAVKITRKYYGSTFVQTVSLTENSPRIDFKTNVDWHEDHVLLKAAFPVDILSDEVVCDIQFGHLSRPTHKNTSWDEAKFEVCAHKWIDLSETGYGVSLLNNCKYGHSVEGNVMRISLLKAATYPNPVADRGEHEFTYSLYPHKGTLAESGTVKEGYLLNQPLTVMPIGKQDGSIPDNYSLVSSSDKAFVIETVKRAENGDGFIVRGYESLNGKVKTDVRFGFDVKSAELCDLQENKISDLAVDGSTVKLSVSNFEIVTLRVRA